MRLRTLEKRIRKAAGLGVISADYKMKGNYDERFLKAEVTVIGGGAAGMSAALAAHSRGHRVTLYERSGRLGGQLYLAAAPPGREEFACLARDLALAGLVAGGLGFSLGQGQ